MAQKCILCNSDSVIPLEFLKSSGMPGNRTFLRCRICDLIFVPEFFHLSSRDEAARYRLHDNTLSNDGYVRMFLEKINLVHQHCPGINSVLDYGCGPQPVLAELIKREGFECDVYDPHFFLEFPGRSYDLVISTEAIEHFRDVKAELQNIISLLKSGGYLAIMTSFHDAAANFEEWWYISDPTHIRFFSTRTFEWLSKEYGFNMVYTNRKNFIIFQYK